MRTIRSRGSVLLLGLLALGALCPASDKKQLSDAIAAVDANLKTAAGKQYDESMGKEFAAKYAPSLRQCKQSSPSGISDAFDIFLKLDGDGKVQEALVYPETPFSMCTRSALLTGKFNPPSHNNYWVNIHLQLKP
jgi:hypothetical protein